MITKEQLDSLVPRETMIYAKSDNVGYTFMGIDDNGKYLLYGVPNGYSNYIIMDCFYLKDN